MMTDNLKNRWEIRKKFKLFQWIIECQTIVLFIDLIKVNYLPMQKLKECVKLDMSYHIFDANKSRY